LGQAGSSFTFEVALKNGIPFSLINRAKKIEVGKVRFDKTIATLQKNVLNWKNLSNAKEEEKHEKKKDGIHQCQNKTKLEVIKNFMIVTKKQSTLVKK
jgi:DNA mismatch repair protein MutS2